MKRYTLNQNVKGTTFSRATLKSEHLLKSGYDFLEEIINDIGTGTHEFTKEDSYGLTLDELEDLQIDINRILDIRNDIDSLEDSLFLLNHDNKPLKLNSSFEKFNIKFQEMESDLVNKLFRNLDTIAPDDTTFTSAEGDGAHFGFFETLE